MGANAVLDIAIGLVLMYLVLSLIGTVLNEFIATASKLRASTLKSGLTEILDNETLRSDFYNHGLVDGTNKTVSSKHSSYISGQTFAMAVLGSVDPTKPVPEFADVKSAIENMPDCNIRDVLLAQLTTANGDLEKLRDGVATYFDTTMDRISGIYKRYLKLISLVVGFVLVLVLNADSIAVGTALWKDSSLRAQMVQNAGTLLESEKATLAHQKAAAPTSDQKGTQKSDAEESIENLEANIRPLPIGWQNYDFKQGWSSLLAKLGGLVLSAFAVSLGAPFWFDLLSKFMNIRGSGPPPQRTDAT